ncbi:MAG: PilZ domain-containing protein [bacterium]|nr:PilZ domain-containing protein [bacterium]
MNRKRIILVSLCFALSLCLITFGICSFYFARKSSELKNDVVGLCNNIKTQNNLLHCKKINIVTNGREISEKNISINIFRHQTMMHPAFGKRTFFKNVNPSSEDNLNTRVKNVMTVCNHKAFVLGNVFLSDIFLTNKGYMLSSSFPISQSGKEWIINLTCNVNDTYKKILQIKKFGIWGSTSILAMYLLTISIILMLQRKQSVNIVEDAAKENILESYNDKEMFKRRRAKRLKADILLLEYKQGGVFGFFRTWRRKPIDDISNTGVGIFSKTELKKGKAVTVKIRIPGTRNEFITKAGIVYSRKLPKKNYFRVGVKFRGKTFSNKALGKLLITG